MKPPVFDYRAPETLEEALALLAEHGDDAKVLAGGQSLIPTLNFRLSHPALLVDLQRIPELAGITAAADGGVEVGAMTRQRDVERSPLIAERCPLVHETMPFIAHPQIRNQGTFGGSLAHADPAAELPAVMVALGARLRLRGSSGGGGEGERTVAAEDFFTGLFETALAPGELLVAVELPPPPPRGGWAFAEVARRSGDYALVGVAATVELDADGRCRDARLVLLSVGEGPVAAQGARQVLVGERPDEALLRRAAAIAAAEDIDPSPDIHASVAYRRHLAAVLCRRALERAYERAARAS
jgi:carbon-monoxide dehydrogenase medium subunit